MLTFGCDYDGRFIGCSAVPTIARTVTAVLLDQVRPASSSHAIDAPSESLQHAINGICTGLKLSWDAQVTSADKSDHLCSTGSTLSPSTAGRPDAAEQPSWTEASSRGMLLLACPAGSLIAIYTERSAASEPPSSMHQLVRRSLDMRAIGYCHYCQDIVSDILQLTGMVYLQQHALSS